jgi:hypothetical protein
VSLVTGAVASTILTLVVVPGLYFLVRRPRGEGPEPAKAVPSAAAEPAADPPPDHEPLEAAP